MAGPQSTPACASAVLGSPPSTVTAARPWLGSCAPDCALSAVGSLQVKGRRARASVCAPGTWSLGQRHVQRDRAAASPSAGSETPMGERRPCGGLQRVNVLVPLPGTRGWDPVRTKGLCTWSQLGTSRGGPPGSPSWVLPNKRLYKRQRKGPRPRAEASADGLGLRARQGPGRQREPPASRGRGSVQAPPCPSRTAPTPLPAPTPRHRPQAPGWPCRVLWGQSSLSSNSPGAVGSPDMSTKHDDHGSQVPSSGFSCLQACAQGG